MKEDGLTQFAKMLKDREPITPPSITTGVVVSSPPEPLIALNDVIDLDKSRLVFAASLVGDYERQIKFTDTGAGYTSSENDGGEGASSHKHDIEHLDVDTVMTWTDTLQPGDEVILVPVMDGQLYYVLDKAVRY